MIVVIDTNVVSELMRPTPNATVVLRIDALPVAEVFTTAITVAEVAFGIERMPRGKRRMQLEKAAEQIFDELLDLRVLSFDDSAARFYGRLCAARESAGRPISQADAMIAAICLANDAALATRNVADFDETDVALINPWLAG